MPSIDLILTHPGSAHKDELLACSVLLARYPVRIVRREPEPAELEDASVCVVDVGHRHEPLLHNFDHHQFPREQAPTCSLSLVLQFFGLYEDARLFCEWLEVAEWFDCRGPVATAQWLGVERELLNQLNSPLDMSVLKRFSQSKSLEPGEPLWELLRMIGTDLLDYLESMHERLAFLAEQAQFWKLSPEEGGGTVLFLPRTETLAEDPSLGLERFVDQQGLAREVVATVYPDRRGGGYGLSRFRDHPRFDFLQLQGHPAVHFTHARGFLAKTSLSEPGELRALLRQALAKV